MGKTKLIMAMDPDGGQAGLYLDSHLVWDFYADDPFTGILGIPNQWDAALGKLAEALDMEYDTEARHPLGVKVNHPMDPDEWDSYWPQKLEDAPVAKMEDYGPLNELSTDGDDIILIG